MTRPELTGVIDDLQGSAAVPRSNGELVFSQPWEARAFALASGGERDRFDGYCPTFSGEARWPIG